MNLSSETSLFFHGPVYSPSHRSVVMRNVHFFALIRALSNQSGNLFNKDGQPVPFFVQSRQTTVRITKNGSLMSPPPYKIFFSPEAKGAPLSQKDLRVPDCCDPNSFEGCEVHPRFLQRSIASQFLPPTFEKDSQSSSFRTKAMQKTGRLALLLKDLLLLSDLVG